MTEIPRRRRNGPVSCGRGSNIACLRPPPSRGRPAGFCFLSEGPAGRCFLVPSTGMVPVSGVCQWGRHSMGAGRHGGHGDLLFAVPAEQSVGVVGVNQTSPHTCSKPPTSTAPAGKD